MRKTTKWVAIGVLIFMLAAHIYAQDAPMEEEELLTGAVETRPFAKAGLNGGGLTFIDSNPFLQIQLQPDIPIGALGLGLDLVVLYNPFAETDEPRFLAEDAEDWNNPSTWLRLIRYIRYGQPNEPFHFRFGELDYLTIGHGSIMSGYSNYDRRGVQLNLRSSDNRYGVETMLNDIGAPTIFGGRAFFRPFQRAENNSLFTRFEVGATYLTDIDANVQEIGEEPLIALGADVGFPIFETGTFRLNVYDDVVFLNTGENRDGEVSPTGENRDQEVSPTQLHRDREVSPTGGTRLTWGNAVGVGFAWTQAVFKLEYRMFGNGYIPSVFDYTYESAKIGLARTNMPQFLDVDTDTAARRGYFSQLIWQPLPQFYFLGTFEDYTDGEPKLYIGVTESGVVPRLSARAFYTKRDIGEGGDTNFFGDLFDLDEKSAFSVELRYAIYPPLETIILREYRFRRVETGFEPIHKTSVMFGIKREF